MFMWIYIYICASTNGLLLDIIFIYFFKTLLVCWLQVSHLSTILLTKINNINLIKKRV